MGGKEMENQQEANDMVRMFEWMLQEQRTMLEVVAAVERLVQRKGRVTLFTGLQGGDVAVRNIIRGASKILQSSGYGWALREYPRDMTTKSNMGGI